MRQLRVTKQLTDREGSLSIEKYITDIAKTDLLTVEEEIELTKKLRDGDIEARNRLVMANLRFVVSCAKKYQYNGVPFADLINEGNLGLIKAAERFDDTYGFRFITYAVWWIRQTILEALNNHKKPIRLPSNKTTRISKMIKANNVLQQKLGRDADISELAEILGDSYKDVEELIALDKHVASLDRPFTHEPDSGCMIDVLVCEDDSTSPLVFVNKESNQIGLKRVMDKTLSDKENEILEHFFGLNGKPEISLSEIGKKFDLTAERVRQIKEKAIRKMRMRKDALIECVY